MKFYSAGRFTAMRTTLFGSSRSGESPLEAASLASRQHVLSEGENTQVRILHISEALAAGVLYSISMLARSQSAAGLDVTVAHTIREDTPDSEALDDVYFKDVERVTLDYSGHSLRSFALLVSQIRELDRRLKPDIVHLHSSIAGAAGRLALRDNARHQVVYSPHGFSFLRQDMRRSSRAAMRLAEQVLARSGSGLILVSESEAGYARKLGDSVSTAVLQNSVDVDMLPQCSYTTSRPTVVTAARVTYAKAPWLFAEAARSLSSDADFEWIGSGPDEHIAEWIGDAPIHMTGWVDEAEVERLMGNADIFFLPSRWEGMPVALIQAQVIGLPAVATRIVGNVDVIEHGVTGFLAEDDSELMGYLDMLIHDPEMRRRLGTEAAHRARERFDNSQLAARSVNAYASLGTPRQSRSQLTDQINESTIHVRRERL